MMRVLRKLSWRLRTRLERTPSTVAPSKQSSPEPTVKAKTPNTLSTSRMPISRSPEPLPAVRDEVPSGHPEQFGWWITELEGPSFAKNGDLVYYITWRKPSTRSDAVRIPYRLRSHVRVSDAVMVSPQDIYTPYDLWTVSVSFVNASIIALGRS